VATRIFHCGWVRIPRKWIGPRNVQCCSTNCGEPLESEEGSSNGFSEIARMVTGVAVVSAVASSYSKNV
jgi:hypothetical protein